MSSAEDAYGNDLTGDGVFLVQRALVGAGWVCAPKYMTQMEVQLAVNRRDTVEPYLPNGTGWTVLARRHEDPGLRSPGCCEECDELRQHWFVAGGLTGYILCLMSSDDESGFRLEDQAEDSRQYIESLTVGELEGNFFDPTIQ